MKIKQKQAELQGIPNNGREISFGYPPVSGIVRQIVSQLDHRKLARPTSSYTASLVCDAWKNPLGQYESEIIRILRDSQFLEFTGNLYLPKGKGQISDGVLMEDDPEVINGRFLMYREDLTKRLEGSRSLKCGVLVSKCGGVRFVPFGYKTGEQSASDLGRNPNIIGKYGEEDAEKIAEVAGRYDLNPILTTHCHVNEETIRGSALVQSADGRINISGVDSGSWIGHAFGLIKVA